MTRKFASIAGLTFVCWMVSLVPAGASFGQRVWVGNGGVRVRAPFVRVDVGPYGGVSVRAPFADVDVPPPAYYEPYPVIIDDRSSFMRPRSYRMVEPSFPTAGQFAAMSNAQLTQQLLSISEQLERRLSRFDTGDTWQSYFRFPKEALGSLTPPDVRREALVKSLDRFHKVAADPQYSMIARLPAFVAMEAALAETLSRPNSEDAAGSPAGAEELPLPSPQQPQQPPQPQTLLPPQNDGPFLRPKTAPALTN